MKSLAQRLRIYRAEHDMNQKDFATSINRGLSWVTRLEAGYAPKKTEDVFTLAKLLGVAEGELLAEFATAVAS